MTEILVNELSSDLFKIEADNKIIYNCKYQFSTGPAGENQKQAFTKVA